jgi:hypothetical protein
MKELVNIELLISRRYQVSFPLMVGKTRIHFFPYIVGFLADQILDILLSQIEMEMSFFFN